MFFKKKATPPTPKTKAENRAHYRKRASKSQALEAHLKVKGWDSLPVELVDLSVRGAGIRIPFAKDRNLKVGDMVELTIGSMMRSEVATAARVANLTREGQTHLRYGLEFVNVNKLYAQLDDFYARHFNRRRHVRVIPTLDRKLPIKLRFGGEEVTGTIHDISESGVGAMLTKDGSARIVEVESFDLSLKLPGMADALEGRALVVHRTAMGQHTLVGLKFDEDPQAGFARHASRLAEFVTRRMAEIAKWEQ